MSKQFDESIEINSTPEIVWETLINPDQNKFWYGEFAEGAHPEGDWEVGQTVTFADSNKTGLVSKVIESEKDKAITIEYEGSLENGEVVLDSDEANLWKGLKESYKISQKDGKVVLEISAQVPDDYFGVLSKMWNPALQKIKLLAEKIKSLEDEGFSDIFVCDLPPTDSEEHTHDTHTVHYILDGELSIKDSTGIKLYSKGDVVEFPAGTTHTAMSEGGMMIVGEKK